MCLLASLWVCLLCYRWTCLRLLDRRIGGIGSFCYRGGCAHIGFLSRLLGWSNELLIVSSGPFSIFGSSCLTVLYTIRAVVLLLVSMQLLTSTLWILMWSWKHLMM